MAKSVPRSDKIRIPQEGHNNTRGKNLTPVTAKTTDTDNTSASYNSTQITHSNPNTTTGEGFGVNDTPVRSEGPWTKDDIKNALFGASPKSLGKPDLHHAQNMPGSAIHEVDPSLHRGNTALHPNKNK
ncbi:hypothetical protein P1X15_29555 [Runella sp. MFBS21]|uniref:hypothetical protein n=1 Tax=Runella sp. MFBS21 TaxID=3034018 RepID=UPI0023F6AD5B|nr:hypothetical protein [Runella sp. MFBS21]MDF7821800.1 hypothetical protein [Runella sp. MFBS21]